MQCIFVSYHVTYFHSPRFFLQNFKFPGVFPWDFDNFSIPWFFMFSRFVATLHMLKQGKMMTWQENLQNVSFDTAQSIYLLDCLIVQSHISDCVCQLPHILKKILPFYQLHQENFKNDMVVAIVLALQFNTGKSPRALFHLKLLLAEPEWEISWSD